MIKRPVYVSLILSVLLHLAFVGLVWIQPSFDLDSAKRKKPPAELVFIDADELLKRQQEAQDKMNGQIVSQNDSINEEAPKDTRFLSKQNQKIEQETVAQLNDQFRNTTGTGGPASPQKVAAEPQDQSSPDDKAKTQSQKDAGEQKPTQKTEEFITSNQGVPRGVPSLDNLKPQFKFGPKNPQQAASGGGDGPSATDDHLQDVNKGLQTLLNTREFVYYSYYNRIKEKLRQYWEPKIRERMIRIMQQGRTIASSNDRITKVIIILDSNGTLVGVQVLSASGIEDLDQAAVEAFRAAAPFPNPPDGIVEADGKIRIRWDFILEANNSTLIHAQRVAMAK